MIGRSSVLSQIAIVTTPKVNGTKTSSSEPVISKTTDTEGDVEMQVDGKSADSEPPAKDDATVERDSTPVIKEQSPSLVGEANLPAMDKFQQCLEPITVAIDGLYGDDAWRHLTSEFYVTFWITTLSEIAVPKSSYENAIQRLLAQESEHSKPDRNDTTRAGIARRAEAKQAATESKAAIVREWNQHMEYAQKLKVRFSKRKNFWFNQVGKADLLSDDILEKCIFPRMLLSPTDADFCFSMIKYMHDTGTPHFRLLSLYSRLFRTHRLRSIIFTCTVREASNLGRFLRLVLNDLARWHASSALYEKEALGTARQNLIGFAKALDADGKPKGFLDHDGKSGFRNVLLAWHKNINTALRDCLDGHEWMHIRNAITVLKSVVEVFPAVDFMGNGFIKQLETIADREKDVREDLALLGNAVMVGLKKRSKKWVMVQAFGFSMV
jgi:THO complex subunit 2